MMELKHIKAKLSPHIKNIRFFDVDGVEYQVQNFDKFKSMVDEFGEFYLYITIDGVTKEIDYFINSDIKITSGYADYFSNSKKTNDVIRAIHDLIKTVEKEYLQLIKDD